jgi:hypothetical protein
MATEMTKRSGLKGQGAYEKNTLSFHHKLRLARYLEARKDQLLRDRPRYETVAADASKELEIEVHESIVRSTARATGLLWKQIQTRRDNSRLALHHNNTRNQINLLKQQVGALKKAVCVLCSRLGEEPPIDLTQFWPAMTPEDNSQPTNP